MRTYVNVVWSVLLKICCDKDYRLRTKLRFYIQSNFKQAFPKCFFSKLVYLLQTISNPNENFTERQQTQRAYFFDSLVNVGFVEDGFDFYEQLCCSEEMGPE